MKHLFILLLFSIAVLPVLAGNDAAIAYNDKIVKEQTKIGESILAFSNNPNDFSLSQIKQQAEKSLAELKKMKPYEGNKEFLDAAKALFKFYVGITDKEYKKILDIIQHKEEYTSNEITSKVNELTNSISKREDPLDADFQAAQKAFAKKYNFILRKNELSDKLEKAADGE